jgi:gliding motility-associated-like protein
MSRLLYTFLFCSLIFSSVSLAQPNKRTNYWYFPVWAGLNFNSGEPEVLTDGKVGDSTAGQGCAVMSDTNGSLLFYSDGDKILRKDHLIMWDPNEISYPGTQGALIIPKPGTENIFYTFFIDNWYSSQGPLAPFRWTTIDMSLSLGYGQVIALDTIPWPLTFAADKLTAVYQQNKHDIWVIIRKYSSPSMFAAIPVTDNGVMVDNIVFSPAPEVLVPNQSGYYTGCMKVSYDKKYLISTFADNPTQGQIEICTFNSSTGKINFLYGFDIKNFIPPFNSNYRVESLEFSPDSKLLYIPAFANLDSICDIYQYDMQYILDPALFPQSYIKVGQGQGRSIQLASDGKLYLSSKWWDNTSYLGVIHKPWLRGIPCEYEPDAIYLEGSKVLFSLPNFMTDYLLRFDFEGQCALDTFYFDPWFFPTPTWIQWDFGDTASGSQNVSNELHSKHAFTRGGEFEVSVLLTYPSGRVEKTSRVVEVDSVPFPKLGPDTLICKGSSLVLNANCNAQFFTWSTNQWGTPSITVSDTGFYWVRASYANGCDNYDTIHVGFLPEIQFDETNLLITPTACGGASGSITGLYALGPMPLAYEWKDLSGNVLGDTTDLYNLGVGQYYLSVTDGNGCTAESPLYTITDAGNLQVDSVTVSGAICGQGNGVIQVHATPQPGGQLFYSIDNGDNFFDNGGLFENLSPGDYVVMIKDLNNCEGVYTYNPVSVADLTGPNITSAASLPEIDFLQNGEILIDATGSTSDLYYSINNGASWQTNNGNFTGLSAGIYDCIVRDENNCDTTFQVEVTRFWATILQAIAGSTDTCTGTTFEIPLLVENFNDVSKFRMHLSYNNILLDCLGYANVDDSIADSLNVFINETTGEILIIWQDYPSVTLLDQAPVMDIVFTDSGEGQGTIDWYGQAQESYFVKSTADTLAAAFTTGTVRISSPPSITGLSDITLCEGEELLTFAMVQGSNPIVDQHWLWPDGSTHPGAGLMLFELEPGQSGAYIFTATDSRGCTSEESMNLTVIPTPDPALPNGDTLTLEAGQTLDAGSGFSSYSWNTGETAQTITPSDEDWYKVTVSSTNNCQGTDSVYITFHEEPVVEPLQYFYVPNAFTPDGDGRNDEFRPVWINPELSIVDCRLSIFDRWGGLIFEGDDISAGWDGTKNEVQCPGGVYVYRITFRVSGVEEEQVMAGTLAVIR